MNTASTRPIAALAALLLLAGAGPSFAGKRPGNAARFVPQATSMRKVMKTPAAPSLAAFSKFSVANGGGWKVRYNPRTALPESITGGRTTRAYRGAPAAVAAAFLSENSALLGIDPAAIRPALSRSFAGMSHLQYQQYYKGLPVEFSNVRVHITESGRVAGYQSRFEPDLALSVEPSITKEQAVVSAITDAGYQLRISSVALVIYPEEQNGGLKLAWKVRGRAPGSIWVYYVDAVNGAVLFRYDDMRRYCGGTPYTTMGTSSATVYEISPYFASDNPYNQSQDSWVRPVQRSMSDQYYWVGGYSTYTATNIYGDYCLNQNGKVFSTFKGPYFSVANFLGPRTPRSTLTMSRWCLLLPATMCWRKCCPASRLSR
jgi:hypothetical protein